jgi:transposase
VTGVTSGNGGGDTKEDPIPVAIETSRGLLVARLRATGRPVYAINPMAAARYRNRHAVSRRKSDHLDAMVLANILRTDAAAHRQLPRSTRDGGGAPAARVILASAPTPVEAAKLTCAQLRALQKKAGRQRGIDPETERLHGIFRLPHMRQPPLVEDAMGRQTITLVRKLEIACTSADDLAQAAVESFEQHPDARIITSFPGLGSLTGARVLAELGDDRSRFTDAKGLKAFAGAAPVTRASGKSVVVMARRVKNQRLAAAGYVWAFAALTASLGARAHYDRRREAGDRHTAAQRNLFNRMLGCLHHCLTGRIDYDEAIAFLAPKTPNTAEAA